MKVTKRILTFSTSFALILLMAFSSIGSVDVIPISTIYLADGTGTTNGGIFKILDDSQNYLFDSFCLERIKYIDFTNPFKWSISTGAIAGGISGGNPDQLDARTAYLYYNFRMNTLDIGNFDKTDAGDANSLQRAIWEIEGEKYSNEAYAFGDTYAKDLIALAQSTINTGAWAGLGNVRVLNLVDKYDKNAQSQLTLVPEPASLLLLGISLICVSLVVRKTFRHQK